MNPSEEDQLCETLFKFVERVFISLYPEPSLYYSQEDFIEDKRSGWRNLKLEIEAKNSNSISLQKQSETFWFCVGLYNLHFKSIYSLTAPDSIEGLKEKLARGVLAYEQLLSANNKLQIEGKNLNDVIFLVWVKAFSSFFGSIIE